MLSALLLSLPLRAATPAFHERVRAVIEAYAHPKGSGPLGYANIAAKLRLHEDAALCSRRLEELLAAGPTGDMFWMFPVTAIAYLDQGQLTDSGPAGAAPLVPRPTCRTAATPRITGCSITRRLYLMAQMWPDQDGDQWYTGKSSDGEHARSGRLDRIPGSG